MKVWPSILSTDGVSVLIVVQETDVHSNQRCSIYCYHLASNDTCPPVTRRAEGNMLDMWGGQTTTDPRKRAILLSQTDRTTLISSRLLILNENSNKSKRMYGKNIILWRWHTLTLPWITGVSRIHFHFRLYFRIPFVLPLNSTATVSLIAWFSLPQL